MTVGLIAAVIAGILIAVQTTLIGALGARMSPFVAAVWVHFGGLVFGVIGVLVSRIGFQVGALRQAPWGLLAGVAGMLLVTSVAVAVGGAGLASTLAVVTGVQMLVGFAIESSGLVGRAMALDPARLAGAGLIVVGVYLIASRTPVPA